jgi:multidrug efflux system membrane fusion protein
LSSPNAGGQHGLPEPPVSRPEQRPYLDVAAPLAPSRDRMSQTATNRTASSVPRRRHRWGQIVVGLILALAALAFYAHWKAAKKDGSAKGTVPTVMINTATAKTGDIGVYVEALGTVTALNTVSLTAQVSGRIENVQYQEGQFVHVGDPLVDIDPAPFQAAVLQAEGQLARDQAVLELANVNLVRESDLLNKKVVSKQEYDTQVATVHQSEGAVKLDQGNLDQAKVNLAWCHITSPIDGLVGLRLVDPGNIVQANGTNALVMITQLQPITVEFNVAEDNVPQIVPQVHSGKQLTVDVYDRANQKKLATGTLEAFNSQIDATTGTLRLRATFKNEDDSLFPNQFVNARLLVDTHKNVTLLPNNAIQRNDNGSFVYLLQPNQIVALKTITVRTTDGNVSEVQDLEAGAVVAADSFNRLSDGAKVAVRPAATDTNPVMGSK